MKPRAIYKGMQNKSPQWESKSAASTGNASTSAKPKDTNSTMRTAAKGLVAIGMSRKAPKYGRSIGGIRG